MRIHLALLLAFACSCTSAAFAVDKITANALAKSAAQPFTDGKMETAKELCYEALAQDEDCPLALYQLGLIFEKEGNPVSAADFLVRASREFGKDEGADPSYALKHQDADARIKHLNEFATRYTSLMTDYVQDLNAATRKMPDSLTLDEACDRVDALNLKTVVPADKGPKFDRPTVASSQSTTSAKKKPVGMDDVDMPSHSGKSEVVTNVPPDVERALKAAGWTTITGTWKKKGEGIYEVTDGRLETPKLVGAIQVIVQKGTGTVKALVRNAYKEYNYAPSSTYYNRYSSGYGYLVDKSDCKMFAPYGSGLATTSYRPGLERTTPFTGPKVKVMVQVDDGKIEFYINDSKAKSAPYRVAKEGPFVIVVDGTMTIENPRAVGE